MNYEVKIGWRYLYGGKREKLMQLLAVAVLGGVATASSCISFSRLPP